MFPFTTHMAASLEILETSPCAAPTDPRLVAWIRLQRIMDTSATSLGLNKTGGEISFADHQIQLILKNCSKQLKLWENHTIFPVMNGMNTFSIPHRMLLILHFRNPLHKLPLLHLHSARNRFLRRIRPRRLQPPLRNRRVPSGRFFQKQQPHSNPYLRHHDMLIFSTYHSRYNA